MCGHCIEDVATPETVMNRHGKAIAVCTRCAAWLRKSPQFHKQSRSRDPASNKGASRIYLGGGRSHWTRCNHVGHKG